MNLKITKSYCVMTLPRTGSEIVMSFLSQSKALHNAREFLNIDSRLFRQTAIQRSDTGIFADDYYIKKDFSKLDYVEYCQFIEVEFKSRCAMLELYEKKHGPIVVKSFINALRFEPFYSLKHLIENYNIVILSRRDIMKSILSGFICEQINFWHGSTQQEFDMAKNKLKDLKFVIPPHKFYMQLYDHVTLHGLQMNLFNKFPERIVPLVYEDFTKDPVDVLNGVFNSNSNVDITQQPFIETHEDHVLNMDELKEIFNIYGTQHNNIG